MKETNAWEIRAGTPEWYEMMRGGKEKHPSHDIAEDIIFSSFPSSMLDVGVGPGVTYERIRNRLDKTSYTGLDISPTAITKLKTMYPDVDFRVGSLMEIPIEDKAYDVVYTRHTLEHCPYYEIPIRELFRVAKKLVVITLFHELVQKDKIAVVSGRNLNYYEQDKFMKFIDSFKCPSKTTKSGTNTVISITKL